MNPARSSDAFGMGAMMSPYPLEALQQDQQIGQYNYREYSKTGPDPTFAFRVDPALAETLKHFGNVLNPPTYNDFYTHLDSVFQCIWAAQECVNESFMAHPHLADAETAMQRLDDFMYEKLGKGEE